MELHEFARQLRERVDGNRMTGAAILGNLAQECDAGADFLASDNYYSWYYHAGAILRPAVIAEMGVRFGYSLKAVIDGSGLPYYAVEILGVDDERDGRETLGVFQKYFFDKGTRRLTLLRTDTQKLTTLGMKNPADLVHVDAWHTEAGCYHECELAYDAVRPGGFILVDDAVGGGAVRAGADRFCRHQGLASVYFPTLRGLLAIRAPDY